MKQTENNEIDLLLRGLARHESFRRVAPEDPLAEHLDADELNSYAEQVLPAAARARYTSHLAECASCRKIVSELTASSGVNVSEHSVSQSPSAGFRQKLAALFAPGRWRYAVPALALFAFAAIGLIVLKQQRQPDFVAMNQGAASRNGAVETKQGDSIAESEKPAVNEERTFSYDSTTGAPKSKDNFARSGDKNETSTTTKSPDSVSVADETDASAGKAAGAVAQPSYAPEPAAPPAPKPQPTHTESRTEVATRQKEEADKKKDEPAREQEGARNRREDGQNQVASAPTAKLGAAVQGEERTRALDSKRASGAGEKTNDYEAETRTVSGRRFRRQGSVWIDTAFQSSTATTIVTRGSEQFRALIADEPGIRAIAAQLAGEVVVVWKGRAYRIR